MFEQFKELRLQLMELCLMREMSSGYVKAALEQI
jgi:hypothetical protein